LIQQGVKDMTTKRIVLLSSLALLVTIVAIGLAPRPIETATPRQLSDRALSIISAVDPHARVQPQDLQCNVKVGWGLAQCGSQSSSCKNCHEVKGEDPVNAKGDWHISHAFGDFCEFCHAGNVQAADKAAAHEGLVEPLGDVQANCSSCHADDYQAKAEKYATALGVTIGTSSNNSAKPPAATPAEPSQSASQPTPQAAQPAASQPMLATTPTSNVIIDYVALYRATQSVPPSTGTAVVSLLLAATVVGGGTFVFWNEMRLRAKRRGPVSAASVPATDERSQELAQLLPMLEKLDAQALRGLRAFLSSRR
jgi:hypothetical protein